MGTRFRRIAPVPDDAVVADVSLTTLAGLKADEASDPEAHGDGSGFSGDIIDAEDDKVDTAPELRPPKTGILRISKEVGLRNSEGRRCRGGLDVSFCIITMHDSFDSSRWIKNGLPRDRHCPYRQPIPFSSWTRSLL